MPQHTLLDYRWIILAAIWFLYYCFGLISQSLAPLVSNITTDLGIGLSAMGRILGAWQLVFLFSAIPLGIAIDHFGLRRSLTVGGIVIATSALLRGVSDDATSLWLAVAVFGLGGPLISIGAPKAISQLFNDRQRGTAMGIYMTGPSIGGITALTLTNSVIMPATDHNWRQVFFIFAMVAVVSLLFWFFVSGTVQGKQLNAAPSAPDITPLSVGQRILRSPEALVILAMSVGIFTFSHGLANWLPEILRAKGFSAAHAGYWAAIPICIGAIASLTVPHFVPPEYRLKILTVVISGALISTLCLQSDSTTVLLTGLLLQGIAQGTMMTFAMLQLVNSKAVGPNHVGIAAGLFFTTAEIGGVAGPVGIGLLAETFQGFDAALWMLTAVCTCLLVLALANQVSLQGKNL